MKFNFNDFLNDNPNMPIDCILDEVYSRLYELTQSEEDSEIRQYDEWLLDGLQQSIQYVHRLEKKVKTQ